MTTELLPPLPAIGNCIIEIYGPSPDAARWDDAIWDTDVWVQLGWHDVTPESMVMKLSWGADDPAGVLTVPAAGSWSVETYDPERKLDPANGSSQFAASLRPGRPMRVSVQEQGQSAEIIRVGLIDEITYDILAKRGTIRGTDIVPLAVQAKLAAGQNDDPSLPDTLRARARYLIKKVGLDRLIYVEPGPSNIEYVQNGGFEQVDDPAAAYPWPDFWQGYPDGTGMYAPLAGENEGVTGRVASIYYSTSWGYRQLIQGLGGTPGAPPIALNPGDKYILSGRAGRIAGTNSGRLFVQDPNAGYVEIAVIEFTNDLPLVRQEVEFTAPSGGEVQVVLDLAPEENLATWHFDDISLIPASDPLVGPLPNDRPGSVWSHIATSAFDALYAMWIDRFGTLRFRSFGAPRDNGFTVGGDTGIPISTLKTNASIANVYTSVRAFDDGAPTTPITATDPASADVYGIITLTRDKPVPDGRVWVDSVLADRAGAGLQYETGTLYPRTFAELMAIIQLEMVDIVHMIADDVVPPLDVTARLLGVKLLADTDTGWTAELITYIPAREWEEAEAPPPIEIEPPPTTQQVVRYYDANKDSRAARDSGGTNLGSGTEGELPVGAWSGWRNRSFIGFPSIPMGDVVSVDKCELELDTSDQVNIGFGSSPKVTVKRVTQSWSEGSSSSPSGSNATKYPGPSVTSTDQRTVAITRSENAGVTIDITGIGRAWRNGAAQYGVGLFSAGEDSTAYTTEFWSRENATASKRPRLKMTLTVAV